MTKCYRCGLWPKGVSQINEKSFLAELRSLLSYMDPEDRDRVIRWYEAEFDRVGPEGEAALLQTYSSPVRQVLEVEREFREAKARGEEPFALPEAKAEPAPAEETVRPEGEETVPAAPASEAVDTAEPAPEETPEGEAPEPGAEPEPASAPLPLAAVPDETPLPAESVRSRREEKLEIPTGEPEKAAPEELPAEPVPTEEADRGPGAGRVLGAILVTIPLLVWWVLGFGLSIIIGAALAAAAVGVGLLGGYLTGYVFSGAISFTPDLLLVIGAALVCFAVALILLWLGLWILFGGIASTIRSSARVYRGILKKEKGEKAHG